MKTYFKILVFALLILATSCTHFNKGVPQEEIARIFFYTAPWLPSKGYSLTNRKTLIAERYFENKLTNKKTFELSNDDFNKLKILFAQAHTDLSKLKPTVGIAGGITIDILFNEDNSTLITFEHYDQHDYQLMSIKKLRDYFDRLFPKPK